MYIYAGACVCLYKMGNCLKMSNSDDISLLRGSDSINHGHALATTEQQQQQYHGAVASSIYSEIIHPVFYPTPSVSHTDTHLTEEEEVKMAKRMGLIQHLPIGAFDGSKKARECVICMIEFCVDEPVRFLPCMHIYHVNCIDGWLMRSLTCPSCMEPVDAALLMSYEAT